MVDTSRQEAWPVGCDGRAQGASLLSTRRLANSPSGLACFSARPVRKASCWAPLPQPLPCFSVRPFRKLARRAGLHLTWHLFVFNRSAPAPVKRSVYSVVRPEVFNGRACSSCDCGISIIGGAMHNAWVDICEVRRFVVRRLSSTQLCVGGEISLTRRKRRLCAVCVGTRSLTAIHGKT